jgi:hypothetical protein
MSRRRAKSLTTEGARTFDRVCEAPGCRLCGEYRAPLARDRLDQHRWFCLEHVRDYNKKWDYFAGLDAEAIEQHIRADTIWRRPVWPLGGRRSNGPICTIRSISRTKPACSSVRRPRWMAASTSRRLNATRWGCLNFHGR